ncbi:MAG: RnfABCDGE type electron transport complex subunit D [Kiritimatiellae bacterium]|nr:RnfABCDGE type electron transport complex subunit D [Kiritimatiellia bacterium]
MKPKDESRHWLLSSSPHVHARTGVRGIMLDVILALLPATAAGFWFFGMDAVFTVAVCVSTCVATEALCRMAMKRESTVGDLSAVVTGLLLALNLPAGIPLHLAAMGSVFAIAVAKQAFGGIGMNPFNPALAARAFMLISFTGPMTTWRAPLARGAEATTCATPLASMKTMFGAGAAADAGGALPSVWDMFIGNMPGCIGEVSAAALLAGAAYLLWRKVISWHIPVAFVVSAAAYSAVAGGAAPHVQILSGGLLIGAFFMATDYATSPVTRTGKLVFGAGCGLLCMLIRQFGQYPEGCSFAILVMNAFTPLIDRWTRRKPFGAK